MADARHLMLEAATGALPLSGSELEQISAHVAGAGFDPDAPERAGGRIAGASWRGRRLKGRDLLPPAEIHYLRHVVVQDEWPRGTTLDAYVESVRAIIRDPASGLFVSRYRGQAWQWAVVRRSGSLRGPGGGDWVLVEYRLETDRWVTAFQPAAGLAYLDLPNREQGRWLRRPG